MMKLRVINITCWRNCQMPRRSLKLHLFYFGQALFNMVVEVPRWSNAKMEVRWKYLVIYFD